MTTLYATDLDGTLLDASAHISSLTAKMFNALTEQGVKIAFVTARTPATVEPIAKDLRHLMPSVVMTGAAIWDFNLRQYLMVHYHLPEHARAINKIFISHGIGAFVYTLVPGTNTLEVYHASEELTPIEHAFVKDRTLNDLKTFYLSTPMPESAADHTVLFFAMGEASEMQVVAEEVRAATGCAADWYPDTYHPGLALLEIFTHGVSKAAGLDELRHLSGADRVVAFGDNLNDIPMLEVADVAVAVDNAHSEVKAMADTIIGANIDNAVIKFIACDSSESAV